MAELQYVIDCLIETHGGKAASDLDAIGSKSKSVGDELFKLGGRLQEGFTGAVEYVGREVMSVAKWGAAGAAAAGAYMIHFQNNFEQLGISIAAILNAQGEVSGMNAGMQKSADLLSNMRRDAAVLPGSFEDLTEIFRTISTPAMGAGMNSAAVEKFAANTMAVGAVMGLRSDQVGREMAMLLEGRASARNTLGARLGFIGDAAKQFNQLDEASRAKKLTDALGKYAPAIEVFKGSFQALSTTFLDNVRAWGQTAIGPLFERFKSTLTEVNAWFDNNQGTISVWAHEAGRFLAEAFDKGKAIILEYGPAFIDFASNMYDKFVAIWRDAEPYVKAIGGVLKDVLESKATPDWIVRLIELYGVMKLGGGANDLMGGMGGKLLLGGAQAAVSNPGAAATAGLGAADAAILTYDYVEGKKTFEDYQAWERQDHDARMKMGYEYVQQLDELGAGTREGADAARGFAEIMHDLIEAGDLLGASMLGAARAGKFASDQFNKEQAQNDVDRADAALRYIGLANAGGLTDKIVKQNAADAKKKLGHGGGGGGQHINGPINITVSSNQAPNQIAKAVMAEIAALRRNPGSSPNAKNFGAASNR